MYTRISKLIKTQKPKVIASALVGLALGVLVLATGNTPVQAAVIDPRQPAPGELFTATDGSVDYTRSAIPANPKIDPKSSSWVSQMGTNTPRLNGPQWQITIYNASNADPLYKPALTYAKSWGCSVGDGIRIPAYATRELPGDGDGWVVVHNRDDGTVKSIWQASKTNGVWKGSCGGVWNANSGGGSETKVTGVGTGAEIQAGFGFIQNSELQSGSIDHALYFTSTKTCKTGFRAPAGKSDGSSTASNCIVMGSRFQLDPSVNCGTLAGASVGEKMICKTMQTYGGYILDSGGPGPISGIGIAGDDMSDPKRLPWQTPGNGMRGTRNCAPVGTNCGIVTNVGLDGSTAALSHIPWNKLRFLSNWNGQ